MHQEAIMFHVLDHAEVVYAGDLSQSTRYVIEHYEKRLDEAIRSGIKILYSDPLHSQSEIKKDLSQHSCDDVDNEFNRT